MLVCSVRPFYGKQLNNNYNQSFQGAKSLKTVLEEIIKIATQKNNALQIHDKITVKMVELASKSADDAKKIAEAILEIKKIHTTPNHPDNKIKSLSESIIGYCDEALKKIFEMYPNESKTWDLKI